MLTPYHLFPDDAKVWVYQANRSFTQDEIGEISKIIENFADQWKSHGKDITAYTSIYYRRFIVFVADEHKCHVGVCSIADSIKLIQELEHALNINFFDRLKICYKINSDMVGSFPLSQLNEMLDSGKISDDTILFNNSVSNKKDFETKWEVALKNSPFVRFIG